MHWGSGIFGCSPCFTHFYFYFRPRQSWQTSCDGASGPPETEPAGLLKGPKLPLGVGAPPPLYRRGAVAFVFV